MRCTRGQIFWFAVISRIVVLLLQFTFNSLCPDHDADAFKSPRDHSEKNSLYDDLVKLLFSGLSRWDGEYFLHIAKYGYTYESTLAFYPLYPMLIHVTSIPIRIIFFALNVSSSVLIAAVVINFVCFVKSALIFYDLSRVILKSKSVAYKATLLYCVNPASIFFSAAYSESLFAYLTFHSMLRCAKSDPYVALPMGLSILTRSNGIVNIGFSVYFELRKLLLNYATKDAGLSLKLLYPLIFNMRTIRRVCPLCNTIILSMAPFIFLQIYNYMIFCVPGPDVRAIPEHIVRYGEAKNLSLAGVDTVDWCHSRIPVAYSHVQRKYWNIGFLNYYEIKQIPNFLLAFPILFTMIMCMKEYVSEHKKYCYTLGFVKDSEYGRQKYCERRPEGKYPPEMFVFVVHGLFLAIFCTLFVHIQVSTRLISSASPLIYWYCALSTTSSHSDDNSSTDLYVTEETVCSKWNAFFLTEKMYAFKDRLILLYFLGYTVIGCFMFSNFLPWT